MKSHKGESTMKRANEPNLKGSKNKHELTITLSNPSLANGE